MKKKKNGIKKEWFLDKSCFVGEIVTQFPLASEVRVLNLVNKKKKKGQDLDFRRMVLFFQSKNRQ